MGDVIGAIVIDDPEKLLDLPPGFRRAGLGDKDDEADGRRDGLLHGGGGDFGDEIFEAGKPAFGIVGVNGGDAAGMAGIPGLEQIEAFAAPDLADENAVRPVAQRRAEQPL